MNAEVIVDVLSKVERVVWIDVLKALSDHLENSCLWDEIVLPQLEDVQYEHELSREEITVVIEQIFQLTEIRIQDSDMYKLLPLQFRELFSSRKDALIELSQRLFDAIQSDLQLREIRDYLDTLSKLDLSACEDCVKSQALDQIMRILNTAPNIFD